MATGIRKRGDSYEAWARDKRPKKKIRKTFSTAAETRSWRSDAQAAVHRRELVVPTKRTIQEAWDTWLESARKGTIRKRKDGARYKPSTLRGYETCWNRIADELGAVRLSELTRRDVQRLVEEMLEDCDASTIRNTLMPLRVIYRRAVRDCVVTVNPTLDLELPEVEGTREWTGTKETAALIVAAVPEGDRALWATALYAGLRPGELRALR